MNPLTLVKRIQNLNSREAALGISENASWHAKYKDSAYVYVGGVPFDLTEGDLLAVFAQYGEIVDVNLVRDKGTGKSKGFAFIAYEDQRSTNLAVDNLNGAQILGRTIRVDHVANYKKREEEDEETAQQKREARGVCRAFQRGECTRGAGCKFSHDEQRAANTGWGQEDKSSKWGHNKYEGPRKSGRGENERSSDSRPEQIGRRDEKIARSDDYEAGQKAREYQYNKDHRRARRYEDEEFQPKSRLYERQEKRARRHGDEKYSSKSIDSDDEMDRKRSRRHESGSDLIKEDRRGGRERMRDSDDERDMMSSRRRESESDHVKEDRRGRERMTTRDRDSSSHRGKDRNDNSRKPYDG